MASSSTARSPRTGSAAAPVPLPGSARSTLSTFGGHKTLSQRSPSSLVIRRRRSSGDQQHQSMHLDGCNVQIPMSLGRRSSHKTSRRSLMDSAAKAQSRSARKLNDAMVYLDGPQVYTCARCRTHLTSHDEIISKSFHGRHGKHNCVDGCCSLLPFDAVLWLTVFCVLLISACNNRACLLV